MGHGSLRRSIRRQWERIRHSLWTLVAHPGQLTAEFRDGQLLLAFRRVYADRWIVGSVKAAVMVVTGLVVGNAMVFLSLWLALKTVS
jgi:hypothetical protein